MPTRPLTDRQRRRGGLEQAYRSKRLHSKESAQAKQVRNKRSYGRFCKLFIRDHPLCCDPFGDHERDDIVVPTTQTHHVIPVGESPDLALDKDNCRGLCGVCHARISAMERNGQDAKGVFE